MMMDNVTGGLIVSEIIILFRIKSEECSQVLRNKCYKASLILRGYGYIICDM